MAEVGTVGRSPTLTPAAVRGVLAGPGWRHFVTFLSELSFLLHSLMASFALISA